MEAKAARLEGAEQALNELQSIKPSDRTAQRAEQVGKELDGLRQMLAEKGQTPSVQFGELKAVRKEAERRRSRSRERVERAEDAGVGAAAWVRRGVDKVGWFGNRSGIVPLAGGFIYFFKHDYLEV